jgi:hypothetical protein
MPTRATKPLCRMVYSSHVAHGTRPEIVITIYPNGEIGLREFGRPRRFEQRLEVGTLYSQAIRAAVNRSNARVRELRKSMSLAEARKKARKENNL